MELLSENLAKLLPVPVKERVIGEVKIICLHQYHASDPVLSKLVAPLFIPLYRDATISELKARIAGLTTIDLSRLRLLYCGNTLEPDDAIVPPDAFEINRYLPEDDDIFRPRIFVSVCHHAEDSDRRNEDAVNLEDAAAIDEEYQRRMAELAEALPQADDIDEVDDGAVVEIKGFDLKSDLERINCGKYFDILNNGGYNNEGSFSSLTEADMRTDDVFVPRKARARILALAKSIHGRITLLDKERSVGVNAKIQKQMLASNAINAVALEGQEGSFATKAAMRNAWDRKKQDEQRLKEELLEAARLKLDPKPKPHPHGLQDKIDKIRWRAKRDEFEFPINITQMPPREFCCPAHRRAANEARESYLTMRYEANLTEVRSVLQRVSDANKGFLSKEALKVIAERQLQKNGHASAISAEGIDAFLVSCVMSEQHQLRREEWASESERRENLGAIPVAIYDGHKFLYDLVALIKAFDAKLI